MKRLGLLLLILVASFAHAQLGPTDSTTTGVMPQTYYISPTGLDTNAGTSGAPWLTPNHALNCGDVIIAQASTSYSYANFGSGKWGTVTCPAGNSVAWLQCATFDACKISTSAAGAGGMLVTASYWGVQGWEVTTGATSEACFAATPPTTNGANIHHIIFANDIANGCGGGGLNAYNNGTASVDYFAVVGSIAYNAVLNGDNCHSGISVYQPKATDSLPGTHIYIGGNYSYQNIDPATCGTGAPNGADGIIFDTFDGSQGLGTIYTQQAVIANNILVGNSGRGIEYQTYTKAAASWPTIYIYNNTLYGNSLDPNYNSSLCADMEINMGYGVTMSNNIVQTNSTMACTGHYLYAVWSYDGSSTNDTISGNWLYAASGPSGASGTYNDDGLTMTIGTNSTTVSPAFNAPTTTPGAPSCGTYSSVPACMGPTLYYEFAPTASGALSYGYSYPNMLQGSDSGFPQWMCSANLPLGLVDVKC